MNEKNLNAVQIRNDIVNLEKPFYSRIEIIATEEWVCRMRVEMLTTSIL